MTGITPPSDGFFGTNGVIKTDSFLNSSDTTKTSSATQDPAASASATPSTDAVIKSSVQELPIYGTYQNSILYGSKSTTGSQGATSPSSDPIAIDVPPSDVSIQIVGSPIPVESSGGNSSDTNASVVPDLSGTPDSATQTLLDSIKVKDHNDSNNDEDQKKIKKDEEDGESHNQSQSGNDNQGNISSSDENE